MQENEFKKISDRILSGGRLSDDEFLLLHDKADIHQLGFLANAIREKLHPEKLVTYVIDRNINYTDIEVNEDITTNKFNEGAYLIRGTIDELSCLTVNEIFDGPLLKHGFIDDDELDSAKRQKVIHVSDLIKIIIIYFFIGFTQQSLCFNPLCTSFFKLFYFIF